MFPTKLYVTMEMSYPANLVNVCIAVFISAFVLGTDSQSTNAQQTPPERRPGTDSQRQKDLPGRHAGRGKMIFE